MRPNIIDSCSAAASPDSREVLNGVGADGVGVKSPIFPVNCSYLPLVLEKAQKSEEKRKKRGDSRPKRGDSRKKAKKNLPRQFKALFSCLRISHRHLLEMLHSDIKHK